MKKNKRVIIVAVGDKQAGHKGALVNPATELPVIDVDPHDQRRVVIGYDNPHLSPMQKEMWEWHKGDMRNVLDLAGKDPIVYLGMGDETQGGVFKDDIAEIGLSPQMLMSYWNMLPWMEMKNVKAAYFSAGTSVHLFGPGDTETQLTHRLKDNYPDKRVEIAKHWELSVNGFRMDIAHHGPGPGIREWTEGNILRLYTQSLIRRLHNNHKPIPNLVLRAHHHRPISEIVTLNLFEDILRTEAWITPPYCLMGAHGQKVTQSLSQMHVGLLAFETVNGKLIETHYKPFWHTIDLRAKEEIEL